MGGNGQRQFRFSPAYELVPFDRLSAAEQAKMAEWGRDPNGFGIVRPRCTEAGTIKAVSRDMALLLYSLHVAGTIPVVAVAGGDASLLDTVWKLVLDGVVEVDLDGRFVSGPAAATAQSDTRPLETIAALSHDAVLVAARIALGDPLAIARQLYSYNRRPMTPRWASALPTSGAVLRYANSASGTFDSFTTATLAQHWETKGAVDASSWISWWPRSAAQRHATNRSSVTYKVYVSPSLESLPSVWPTVVATLAEAGGPPFKLGASARGVLRPDKLVVYFPSRTRAEDFASVLATALVATPAQAVPFTRELAVGGLISMGMDPPADRPMLTQLGVSWRQWVCRRLASYLFASRGDIAPEAAARFALDRIALDGIDPTTWVPSDDVLRGFVAEGRS